jgi:hypothetical protein
MSFGPISCPGVPANDRRLSHRASWRYHKLYNVVLIFLNTKSFRPPDRLSCISQAKDTLLFFWNTLKTLETMRQCHTRQCRWCKSTLWCSDFKQVPGYWLGIISPLSWWRTDNFSHPSLEAGSSNPDDAGPARSAHPWNCSLLCMHVFITWRWKATQVFIIT